MNPFFLSASYLPVGRLGHLSGKKVKQTPQGVGESQSVAFGNLVAQEDTQSVLVLCILVMPQNLHGLNHFLPFKECRLEHLLAGNYT